MLQIQQMLRWIVVADKTQMWIIIYLTNRKCVIFIAMPRSEQKTFQRIIVKYVPLQTLILEEVPWNVLHIDLNVLFQVQGEWQPLNPQTFSHTQVCRQSSESHRLGGPRCGTLCLHNWVLHPHHIDYNYRNIEGGTHMTLHPRNECLCSGTGKQHAYALHNLQGFCTVEECKSG